MRQGAELPGRPPAEVRRLDRHARRARNRGRPRHALDFWLRALSRTSGPAGASRPWSVVLLWEVARTYVELGELGKAQVFFHRALDDLPAGERRDLLDGMICSDLGDLHRRRGDPLTARAFAERALGDLDGPIPELSLVPLSSQLGRLFVDLGDHRRAAVCFARALDACERAPEHPDLGGCLANLAELHRAAGRPRDARALYLRLLGWIRRTEVPAPPAAGEVLAALADLASEAGTPCRAEVLRHHARRAARQVAGRQRSA